MAEKLADRGRAAMNLIQLASAVLVWTAWESLGLVTLSR